MVRENGVAGHVYAVTQGPDRRIGDGLIGALWDAGLAARKSRCHPVVKADMPLHFVLWVSAVAECHGGRVGDDLDAGHGLGRSILLPGDLERGLDQRVDDDATWKWFVGVGEDLPVRAEPVGQIGKVWGQGKAVG